MAWVEKLFVVNIFDVCIILATFYDEAQLLTVISNTLPYYIRVGVSTSLRQIHGVYSNANKLRHTQLTPISHSRESGPKALQRRGIWLRGWGELESVQKPVSRPPVRNLLQLHILLSLGEFPH